MANFKIIMKKILFLLLTLTLLTQISVAHPGSLDDNGGHYNRKTGEYHYHEGTHTESNTNLSKSSASDTENYTYSKKSLHVSSKETQKSENDTSELDFATIFFFFILGIILLYFIYTLICEIIERTPKHRLRNYEELLQKVSALSTTKQSLTEEINQLNFSIPDGYEIGCDNLPKEINSANWGETFTFYQTTLYGKYHKKKNCSYSFMPVHIWKAIYNEGQLCMRCCKNIKLPDLNWYSTYLRKQHIETEQLPKINLELIQKNKELFHTYYICNHRITRFLINLSKLKRVKLKELNNIAPLYMTILNSKEN